MNWQIAPEPTWRQEAGKHGASCCRQLITAHYPSVSPSPSFTLLPLLSPESLFYCASLILSLSTSPFLPSLLSLLVHSDPEQSAQELVYDLRSQCDAIRVTKTVRPYRIVICPINENRAALVVSDGRVMLWELKAHPLKSSANPRYSTPRSDYVYTISQPRQDYQKIVSLRCVGVFLFFLLYWVTLAHSSCGEAVMNGIQPN